MRKADLIQRASTDPAFLQLLKNDPAKALGVARLTPEDAVLVKSVITSVRT